MSDNNSKLTNNALTVMALASEYCRAVELASSTEPKEFTLKMVRLLPRIYMAVTDLPEEQFEQPDYVFGAAHLNEAYYDQIRQDIAATLGEDDAYLETFHEDMKYSDTPIAATVSEGLADIFQVLYNFIEDVRNADVEAIREQLAQLRADFAEYWSRTLCNVMRPLNEIAFNPCDPEGESDEMDFV